MARDRVPGRLPDAVAPRGRGARACGWPWARARSAGWTCWRARSPTSPRGTATSLVRDRLGNWTYAFCVVVDDVRHGVDLVIRGRDLLDATPVQLRLARLLGREAPPRYLHHPLVRHETGRKLSKADGDTAVGSLLDAGRTPAALLGLAAGLAGLQADDAAGRPGRPRRPIPDPGGLGGLGPVLDLPGMVEGVPRDPPGGVPRGPPAARDRRPVGRLAQHLEHRLAHRQDGVAVLRVVLEAELAGVGGVGLVDVVDDLRRSRPPPRGPLRSDSGAAFATRSNTVQAASTSAARRFASVGSPAPGPRRRSRSARRTPSRRRPRPLDDVEREVAAGISPASATGGVAGEVREERLDRQAPRPCPTGPGPASRARRRTPSWAWPPRGAGTCGGHGPSIPRPAPGPVMDAVALLRGALRSQLLEQRRRVGGPLGVAGVEVLLVQLHRLLAPAAQPPHRLGAREQEGGPVRELVGAGELVVGVAVVAGLVEPRRPSRRSTC